MNTADELDKQEVIRQAMSILGSAKTERKIEALAKNRAKFTGHTEETKAKLRAAQAARRERERQERAALGLVEPETSEKKRPGRPRTRPIEEAQAKRPRGRPRKSEGEEAAA